MEHKSPEYKKINPVGVVPAISETDNDESVWCLNESHAILRYLAETRQTPDHWYPKDARKRAVVDAYLDWHHNYLRIGSGGYVFKKLYAPIVLGKTFTEKEMYFFKKTLEKSLKQMENWID